MWVLLVLGALYLLRSVFAVLFASVALAWLFDPLVDRYEARGHRRETGILFLFFVATFGTLALLLVLGQTVSGEVHELSDRLGVYVQNLQDRLLQVEAWASERFGFEALDTEALFEGLRDQLTGPAEAVGEGTEPPVEATSPAEQLLKDLVPTVGTALGSALRSLLAGGMGVIVTLLNLLLVPVFTFYLLRDWDRAVAGIDALVPATQRGRVRRLAREIDARLQAFVRGQLTVCLALGVLYSAGLMIVGVDLSIVVGMGSGLLFIVPYLGTAVGVVAAGLLAVLEFGLDWHLLAVAGVFAGVQLIEGMALTPWIVGDKVGLHPLVVMIALLVGGNLYGIVGMLLAIPATAAAQVLLMEWLSAYRSSVALDDG